MTPEPEGLITLFGVTWDHLTWEAGAGFLTVLVGAGAIFGAYRVGTHQAGIQQRQADIQERQTEILERQNVLQAQQAAEAVALERVKIKTELFDKRIAVYEDVRRWLASILTTGNQPSDAERDSMLAAIDRSQFLFHHSVTERLWLLYGDAFGHAGVKAARGRGAVDRDMLKRGDESWKRLSDASTRLYELFGEELRLGAEGAVVVEAVAKA